jgi:hypothetical protein
MDKSKTNKVVEAGGGVSTDQSTRNLHVSVDSVIVIARDARSEKMGFFLRTPKSLEGIT